MSRYQSLVFVPKCSMMPFPYVNFFHCSTQIFQGPERSCHTFLVIINRIIALVWKFNNIVDGQSAERRQISPLNRYEVNQQIFFGVQIHRINNHKTRKFDDSQLVWLRALIHNYCRCCFMYFISSLAQSKLWKTSTSLLS